MLLFWMQCGTSEDTSLSHVRDSRFAGNAHAPPRYIEGMVYNHAQRKWERTLLDLTKRKTIGQTRRDSEQGSASTHHTALLHLPVAPGQE